MTFRPEEQDRCSLRCGNFGEPPCFTVVEGCKPCRRCRTPVPRALRQLPAQRQSAGPLFTQEEIAT